MGTGPLRTGPRKKDAFSRHMTRCKRKFLTALWCSRMRASAATWTATQPEDRAEAIHAAGAGARADPIGVEDGWAFSARHGGGVELGLMVWTPPAAVVCQSEGVAGPSRRRP